MSVGMLEEGRRVDHCSGEEVEERGQAGWKGGAATHTHPHRITNADWPSGSVAE